MPNTNWSELKARLSLEGRPTVEARRREIEREVKDWLRHHRPADRPFTKRKVRLVGRRVGKVWRPWQMWRGYREQ